MRTLLTTLLFTMALAFSGMANALTITPSTGTLADNNTYGGTDIVAGWTGAGNGNSGFNISDVYTATGATADSLTLLYKDNVGGVEEGAFADSYNTIYNGDLSGGIISYVAGTGTITCPDCYLVVKDGVEPHWYIYNLGSWNGVEAIGLSGFWTTDAGGAISHVAIYGATATNVPEPSISALLGLGLLGMIGVSRRKTVA